MKHRRPIIATAVIVLCATAAFAQQSPDLPGQIAQLESAAASSAPSRADQLRLARLYIQVGRFYEAQKLAEQLIATDGSDADAAAVRDEAAKGLTGLQAQKVEKAEAAAKAAGATDEDRMALADAYYEAGSYVAAADLYGRLPKPMQTREVRLRQARALAWSSHTNEAERIYADLLTEQSTPDVQLEYGRTLSWMGGSPLALKTLNDVYATTHSEASAVALANALAWSGDREAGLRLLRDYTAANANAPDARKLLAELQVSPELRLERVNRLIELAPYNLGLLEEQARLQLDAGRPSEALKSLDALEAHSRSVPGANELRTRAESLRRAELIKAEERRKALNPNNPQSADDVLAVAKAYTGLSDYNNAIRLYEDYLRMKPDDTEARIQYARVLSWDRRYPASQRQYEMILAANPERADLRYEYAQILSYESNYVEAVHTFRSLTDISDNPRARLYSDVPTKAHFNLGQIYRWFGWNEHAVEEQNEALALDSSYAPARQELDLVRHRRPASGLDARYTVITDSSQFRLREADLTAQKWTSQTSEVELSVGRHYFEHFNDQVTANVFSIGGQYRWADRLVARARVGANFYDQGFGSRPFYGVGATWLPSLQSRFALDYNHYDLVYDVSTLQAFTAAPVGVDVRDALDINDIRAHYDYNTGGHWSWLADASHGSISDSNSRDALHGLVSFRLFKAPYVSLGADARYLSYDFRSNRYWSPPEYHSYAGVLQVGQNYRDRFFWTAEAKIGRAYESNLSSDTREYDGQVTVPINDAIDLVGHYGYGKSGRIDSILGTNLDLINYWQRNWYVGLNLKQLFSRDDRRNDRGHYYYQPVGASASPVIPPFGEAH
jgi:tetratricopeptide (TPR) repeat protein